MSESNNPTVKITANNLSVFYKDNCALKIDKLEVQGNVIAVIGHNGSGKSTLIKTLLELLVPRTGELYVSFDSTSSKLHPQDDMAYAPENGAVFNDVTVESYLKLWCRIKQNDASYYKKGGAYILDQLEISPVLKKLGRELSKGQRRRVQIAAGLLTDPKFFLFDEPFDGLDVLQSTQLSSIIQEERKKRAMLISTHRMDIIERISDQVIVLNNGKVSATGSVSEVCRQLSGKEDPFASLFDAMNYHLLQTSDKFRSGLG